MIIADIKILSFSTGGIMKAFLVDIIIQKIIKIKLHMSSMKSCHLRTLEVLKNFFKKS